MTPDITDYWTPDDLDVTDLTDVDLLAERNVNTKVYDPSYELHRLVDAITAAYGLSRRSEGGDLALRVGLARLIDTDRVSFTREEYDVRWTIPPAEWVDDQHGAVELVDLGYTENGDGRIGLSLPQVCFEMADAAIEAGVIDGKTELVGIGAAWLTES